MKGYVVFVSIVLGMLLIATGFGEEISVSIDATKTGQPISKYVYGQFIEHLGNCVYGGIWAEMIKDRKFLWAVGEGKSPWEKTGDAEVVMVCENSYVGKQTPLIKAARGKSGGIVQAELGVVEGKEYVGRIILAGEGNVTVEVSLIWGTGAQDRQTIAIDTISKQYRKIPLEFTAGTNSDFARLEITGKGDGRFYVGAVSLMPADNVEGMRADTLELLKKLDSPVYRWPGGNFVSGYDWRDGIGKNRDRRTPKKNLAWGFSEESNDFGIHEFMRFCKLVGTEPSICVNTGFGDAFSAAQEVEYINGGVDTPMGKWRAANGRAKPWNVKYWFVGNEMFGDWQLGFMKLDHYVIKHNLVAEAMLRADASIKLITSGNSGFWSEKMMAECSEYTDLMSEHFYVSRNKNTDDIVKYVRMIPNHVRSRVNTHRLSQRKIGTAKAGETGIVIDEWNYWHGRWRWNLKDAMGISMGLHEMFRSSDVVFMANYAQTVNVMGAVDTNKTDAVTAVTGLALEMYRKHFGVVPVEVTGEFGPMDVAAAWTKDKDAITVGIVNPENESKEIVIGLGGAKLTGPGRLWRLSDADPMTQNNVAEPMRIDIEEKKLPEMPESLSIPGYSINVYELAVRRR